MQAVDWYRKSAEQGNALGQERLAFMYERGRGLPQDETLAVEWYRKAATQGNAGAQVNLGSMYEHGRGSLVQDEKQAAEWYRKAADQGDAKAKTLLGAIEERKRSRVDLSRTVAELVKKNEQAQRIASTVDPERAKLARDIIEASSPHELRASEDQLKDAFDARKKPPQISPKLWEAIGITLIASFRPDRMQAAMGQKLAEALDIPMLEVGLRWERSDVARHMHELERQASRPEQRQAITEFARELVSKGGRTSEPRARACGQADTLSNQTDTAAAFLEAITTGLIIANAQQAPAPDMEAIRRMVVAMRPLLREAARETVLARCLFAYRELSDAEIDELLQFLRSDAGGRYARGFNDALRDTLLDVTEVFTRTLLEVARQIKARAET
jgi:Sel1 repeat-containing protein